MKSKPSIAPGDAEARAILDAIRHLVRALRISGRDAERAAGLSAAQVFVLHRLRDHEGLALHELASRTFTDPSSVSVVVSRLVEKGMVARVRDTRDARRIALALTTEGRRVARRAPDSAQDRFLGAIATLAPRQRKNLSELLGAVIEGMGLSGSPGLFFEDDAHKRPAAAPRATTARKRVSHVGR